MLKRVKKDKDRVRALVAPVQVLMLKVLSKNKNMGKDTSKAGRGMA